MSPRRRSRGRRPPWRGRRARDAFLIRDCGGTYLSYVSTVRVQFTLYVAGDSPRSRAAVANIRRLAEERLLGRYDVTIVDVVVQPGRAEAMRILTTPTLVKEAPGPPRRVTGDLSDAGRLWDLLELDASPFD